MSARKEPPRSVFRHILFFSGATSRWENQRQGQRIHREWKRASVPRITEIKRPPRREEANVAQRPRLLRTLISLFPPLAGQRGLAMQIPLGILSAAAMKPSSTLVATIAGGAAVSAEGTIGLCWSTSYADG